MDTALAPAAGPAAGLLIPAPSNWERTVEEIEFRWMQQGFARHGGLADGDQVAALLREHDPQPLSALARRIASRELLHIVHRSAILVPMFQFERPHMRLRDGVRDCLLELRDAFDDWELTLWFARPNAWLADAAPVELITLDPQQVLQAARADRFVALG